MSLNRTQSETTKNNEALAIISAAGIKFKKVRFNAFHIICKPEGRNSVKYFPHTGVLHHYNGRSGVTKRTLATPEKFVKWYQKYAGVTEQ